MSVSDVRREIENSIAYAKEVVRVRNAYTDNFLSILLSIGDHQLNGAIPPLVGLNFISTDLMMQTLSYSAFADWSAWITCCHLPFARD